MGCGASWTYAREVYLESLFKKYKTGGVYKTTGNNIFYIKKQDSDYIICECLRTGRTMLCMLEDFDSFIRVGHYTKIFDNVSQWTELAEALYGK